jgi:hypothetical protein
MRGFRFLLLVSVVVLGFGPATAQDLFVNKYKRADSETNSKPSLFVSRGQYERGGAQRQSPERRSVKSRQQDKLALARNAKNVAEKIDVFYAWQNSDRKPHSQEEILSYADSKRALIEGTIMKRKQKLIARLELQDRQRAMSDVRSAKNVRGDSKTQRSAYSGRSANTTKRVTITKPKIYRSDDDSSNTGVYKNYR